MRRSFLGVWSRTGLYFLLRIQLCVNSGWLQATRRSQCHDPLHFFLVDLFTVYFYTLEWKQRNSLVSSNQWIALHFFMVDLFTVYFYTLEWKLWIQRQYLKNKENKVEQVKTLLISILSNREKWSKSCKESFPQSHFFILSFLFIFVFFSHYIPSTLTLRYDSLSFTFVN